MDANGLRQKDLADDLGGESIVSLILKEKRQLNRQQMARCTKPKATLNPFRSRPVVDIFSSTYPSRKCYRIH
jgi:hypothetical protein